MSRFVCRIKEYCEINLSRDRGKKYLESGTPVDVVSKYWVPESAGFGDYNEDYHVAVFSQFGLALIRKENLREI